MHPTYEQVVETLNASKRHTQKMKTSTGSGLKAAVCLLLAERIQTLSSGTALIWLHGWLQAACTTAESMLLSVPACTTVELPSVRLCRSQGRNSDRWVPTNGQGDHYAGAACVRNEPGSWRAHAIMVALVEFAEVHYMCLTGTKWIDAPSSIRLYTASCTVVGHRGAHCQPLTALHIYNHSHKSAYLIISWAAHLVCFCSLEGVSLLAAAWRV